jgi:hypothetical protein
LLLSVKYYYYKAIENQKVTPEGIRYYLDHVNGRTTWIHPLAQEILPRGWRKTFDPTNGVLYYKWGLSHLDFF